MFLTPKLVSTKEYLETSFYLPDFGLYDFYYTPYFLGVSIALDDEEVSEVDLMKAAQIGWTFFLLGYIFKRIEAADYDPCPIITLFGKTGDGKNFHDEKLVPAVNASPSLTEKLDINTTRKSGNRWDNKAFAGGFLKLVGSNSPGNVKSTSKVGVGIVEEPDDTQDNVAGQGDAIGLLEERLKRYIGSKLIMGGTPAVKGLSKTEARLKQSDNRVLPITCHECGKGHALSWANVIWDSDVRETPHPIYGLDDPLSAIYVCPNCGIEWDDNQRQNNVRDTCFKAYDSGDPLAGWQPTGEFHGRAGFTGLSELYVCIPGTSLADVVIDFLGARAQSDLGDESHMIKFINQKLGEPYEYTDDNATEEELRAKVESYPELIAPRKALFLTMGIDVQRDRIAICIYAWGAGFESWIIYFGEIWAANNINDINDPVWSELDKLLFGDYRHETGTVLKVSAAGLDTSDGVTQGATYHYVRSRQKKGVNLMAIKGSSSIEAVAVSVPKKLDLNVTKTKAAKYGLQVWSVGTQTIKDGMASALKLTGSGAGRLHIYDSVRDDFFKQMTGEIKAPSKQARNKLVWQQKSGTPIEAWDCTVYARHAAMVEKLHIKKPEWWQEKEAQLLQVDLLSDTNQDAPNVVIDIDNNPATQTIEDSEPKTTMTPQSQPFSSAVTSTVQINNTSRPRRNSMADLGCVLG